MVWHRSVLIQRHVYNVDILGYLICIFQTFSNKKCDASRFLVQACSNKMCITIQKWKAQEAIATSMNPRYRTYLALALALANLHYDYTMLIYEIFIGSVAQWFKVQSHSYCTAGAWVRTPLLFCFDVCDRDRIRYGNAGSIYVTKSYPGQESNLQTRRATISRCCSLTSSVTGIIWRKGLASIKMHTNY